MRGAIVVISVLIVLVMVSSSVQAQEETEDEDNVIIDIVLPLALAFIMFSLGLGLTTGDFALVFREPRAFTIGIVNQMLVLPIVGFAIASLADLDGELAVGLMILACCPGGVTSNILTKLAKRRYCAFNFIHSSCFGCVRDYVAIGGWLLNGPFHGRVGADHRHHWSWNYHVLADYSSRGYWNVHQGYQA